MHRSFVQSPHLGAGEGRTVTGTDVGWDAEFLEAPQEARLLAHVPTPSEGQVPPGWWQSICTSDRGPDWGGGEGLMTLPSTLSGGDLQVCHSGDEPQESPEATKGDGECTQIWREAGAGLRVRRGRSPPACPLLLQCLLCPLHLTSSGPWWGGHTLTTW